MDKNSEEPCTRKSIQILKLVSSLLGPPAPMPPDLVWVASTSWMMTVQSALRSTMLPSLVWVTSRNFAQVWLYTKYGVIRQFIYVFSLTILLSGVTLTLSSLVDLKNFNQGGHKIGMALELEA